MKVLESVGEATSSRRAVTLGDVVENVTAVVPDPEAAGVERFVGLDHLDPGSLRLRRWGSVAEGTTFTRRFLAGQTLFGKRRAYQRKVAVPDFDGVCSGDILVLEAKEGLNPRLLPFILQGDACVDHACGTSAGSLSPRTKWSQLQKFSFTLPGRDEQGRLVELLEATAGVVDAMEKTTVAVQDGLDAIVTQFLTENDWPVAHCEELLARPPRNGVSPAANSESRGYPTLSISAVKRGRIVSDEHVKWADVERSTIEPFLLEKDDVLVVRGNGSRDLTGRCGRVEEVPKDCFYPDLLIRLQFDERRMRPAFAALQWNSRVAQRQLMTRAKSTNGIWKVNGKDLKQQQLGVPPLSAQDELLRRVSTLEQLQRQAEQRTGETRALLIALIADRLPAADVH